MSHLLWKSYWENDVEKFRRLLAPAGPNSQHTPKSPALGHSIHSGLALSPVAGDGSPRSAPKSRKGSGYFGSSGKYRDPALVIGRNEVNSRDHAGLTILLRAASSTSPDARRFIQALLEHPAIDIHVQDPESGWNTLHRSLYAGNIYIARMILDKEHLDMLNHASGAVSRVGQLIKTKDNEGNSPFDLYNSTIGTRSAKLKKDGFDDSDSNSDTDEATGLTSLFG